MTEEKKRSRRFSLTYVARLTIVFALVAAFTAILAIAIVSMVWNVYFNEYTTQNVQTMANNTANRIALLCDDSGELQQDCIYPAEQSALVSPDVGIKVLDANGNTFYDSAKDPVVVEEVERAGSPARLSQPNNPEQIAFANIIVNHKVIGSVRVWVYGSSALMNKLDLEFRDNSYNSLFLAGLGAMVVASILGVLFARGLVAPIKRLSRTALAVKEGDFTARANIKGNDEIAHLGETFDEMVASIEKDRQLERRLVSDVAHELRTPLMGIQSTVEAMIDGVYAADNEHLEMVNVEVKRLSRLVDALLKLSRLENRSQQMREDIINLGELVSEIAMTHQLFVSDSGLEMEFDAEPDVTVVGDSDMLRQAVVNLMSNAVRYTPEGGKISLDVRRNGSFAEIIVADSGIGISPEDLKMVFSRFWRADAGRSRASGGLGIGLAIVKEVVDRHKGKVSVESELGVGTAFTIKLPMYIKSDKPAVKTSGNPRSKRQREKADAAGASSTSAAASDSAAEESSGGGALSKTTPEVSESEGGEASAGAASNQIQRIEGSKMATMSIKPDYQGKVRDIYDLDDRLLLVATDRISAFDYILPDEIPHKGQVLTQLSKFWFELLEGLVPNHLISCETADLPEQFKPYADYLEGRFMLVRKMEMLPVECIVRGYLAGSGLKEYKSSGTVCGIKLPEGLENSSKLPEAIFTPSTKADIGSHDENISFERCAQIVGVETAQDLSRISTAIYNTAAEYAAKRGIIIADTKLEFGMVNGSIVLGDEVLTPDSSRFWPADKYEVGEDQPSFDKQYVRDWLSANWDRQGTPPHLPEDVIKRTSEKYIKAYELITGKKFPY